MLSREQFEQQVVVPNYRNVLYRCGMLMNWHDDHRDVTQEVFLRAWTDLGRQRSTNYAAWLNVLSSHCSFDWKRRHSNRYGQLEPEVEAKLTRMKDDCWLVNPFAHVWGRQIGEAIYAALNEMAEMYRRPFIARFMEDKTLREAGEEAGCELSAADKRIRLAQDFMRERLSTLTTCSTPSKNVKALTVHRERMRQPRTRARTPFRSADAAIAATT